MIDKSFIAGMFDTSTALFVSAERSDGNFNRGSYFFPPRNLSFSRLRDYHHDAPGLEGDARTI